MSSNIETTKEVTTELATTTALAIIPKDESPGYLSRFIGGFVSKLKTRLHARRIRKSLINGLSDDLYSEDAIECSTRFYVEPDCQSVDPEYESVYTAGAYGSCSSMVTRQKLFGFMDFALDDKTPFKYIVLLADAGMGKSSFLLNYFASHLRRDNKGFGIALLPFGIPDIDDRISKVDQSENTVLFLDALNEDPQANEEHVDRLKEIIANTRNFKKIVITCRTQFFSNHEEMLEDAIVANMDLDDLNNFARDGKGQLLNKVYLSPFSVEQIEDSLKCRYSLLWKKQRNKLWKVTYMTPGLIVHPMLLSYINDLELGLDEELRYSFEIYEKIVEVWLGREEGRLRGIRGRFKGVIKESLREFSENLAVNIFLNRAKRGTERIKQDEVVELAKEWDINLNGWEPSGSSLLNKDSAGNYKYAHRSIMEYLFVKKFMRGEGSCLEVEWTDQMRIFVRDMVRVCIQNGEAFAFKKIDLKLISLFRFRALPSKEFSDDNACTMIAKHKFFDKLKNSEGKGVAHKYDHRNIRGEKIVVDYNSGLMWQQSGSDESLNFENANAYIALLNTEQFAGYNDWRLPTLEEAMSLVDPEKSNSGLNVDSVFDSKQGWIWTSDVFSFSRMWVVVFYDGYCNNFDIVSGNSCVRAVR